KLEIIGGNRNMVGREETGVARPLERQHRIVAAEGLETGARDLQDSRPALQRLDEAFDAVLGQSPGSARENNIVAAEAQIDVAGELNLLEHPQGADAQADGNRELQYHQSGAQPARAALAGGVGAQSGGRPE